MRCSPWLSSVLLVVLAGCAEEGPSLEEIEDIGGLCIFGDGEFSNTSYVENTPVDVHVVLSPCVGASTTPMTSCSIEQDGLLLRVSATASYWTKAPGPSTNECAGVVADCTSEPLPAGTYTVEFAGETTTLEVPSTGTAVQLGSIDWPRSACEFGV